MAKKARMYCPVPAQPVKSFFVEMLTRDIELSDAILDLLDNCVDGIIRSKSGRIPSKHPYQGFRAEIKFDNSSFTIIDNCGGIPWNLHEYAFRMGNPEPGREQKVQTVGVYGIGMKRAIFKIGRHCLIRTKNKMDSYEVEISPDWLEDQDNWEIPVKGLAAASKKDGTTIKVTNLNDGVATLFRKDKELFKAELIKKISSHYAFIIDKGFQVKVNGETVTPKPTKLRFEKSSKKPSIKPFIYETQIDGVDVYLAVGFTHPLLSQEEIDDEQEKKKRSSLDAGWTIICNDRAVVYCDRTELTGWGEANVPKYHTQFIGISGIVEFRCEDASKLPTTTSKRGVDASSRLYLQVKNKMREGLKMFTDFTNKWKGKELVREAQNRIGKAESLSLPELKKSSAKLNFSETRIGTRGKQYKPSLPMPRKTSDGFKRISFIKSVKDIREVTLYLYEEDDVDPSEVGEYCFDLQLKEAKR